MGVYLRGIKRRRKISGVIVAKGQGQSQAIGLKRQGWSHFVVLLPRQKPHAVFLSKVVEALANYFLGRLVLVLVLLVVGTLNVDKWMMNRM